MAEAGKFNTEPTPERPPLDRNEILLKLAQLNQELGWELEEDVIGDLEGDNRGDDNDFLGNLATFALMRDIDYEMFFRLLGIDIEQRVENNGSAE